MNNSVKEKNLKFKNDFHFSFILIFIFILQLHITLISVMIQIDFTLDFIKLYQCLNLKTRCDFKIWTLHSYSNIFNSFLIINFYFSAKRLRNISYGLFCVFFSVYYLSSVQELHFPSRVGIIRCQSQEYEWRNYCHIFSRPDGLVFV